MQKTEYLSFADHPVFRALTWPILAIVFNLPMFYFSGLFGHQLGTAPSALISAIGSWSSPLLETYFFSTTGIIVTFLLGVSAMTGFSGNWSRISNSAHSALVSALHICTALLVAFVSLLGPSLIHKPRSLPTLALLFLCSWLTWLLLDAIRKERDALTSLIHSRVDHARRLQAAKAAGLEKALSGQRTPKQAALRFWGIPFAITFAVLLVSSAFEAVAGQLHWLGFLPLAMTITGLAITIGSYRMTADQSEPGNSIQVLAWGMRLYAYLVVALSGALFCAYGAGSLFIGCMSLLAVAGAAMAFPRSRPVRIWLGAIQAVVTARSLQRSQREVAHFSVKLRKQTATLAKQVQTRSCNRP